MGPLLLKYNEKKNMKETLEDPNYGRGFQQQSGESTNSSFDDHVDSSRNRMDEERIVRRIAHLLTQLSIDDPGTLCEKNGSEDGSIRTRRRRRELISSSPGTSAGNRRRSTTPEREVPLLLEQSLENAPLQPLIIGIITPDCPAPDLIEISQNEGFDDEYPQQYGGNETEAFVAEKKQQIRSRSLSLSLANQKLAAALFSHPQPLRYYCAEVYQMAKEQSFNIINAADKDEDADGVLLHNNYYDESMSFATKIPRHIVCENRLVWVTLDTWSTAQEITLDVSFATVSITGMALDASVHIVMNVWDGITRFNPLVFVRRPFNMMGMTTEVVVSGFQSVATGVGSASSIALNRLSVKNPPSSTGLGSPTKAKKLINQKFLQKLNNLNSAASVVCYTEFEDNNGGLSKQAKNRVQRMMHYDVSLRPFVATIKLQDSFKKESPRNELFYHGGNDDGSGDDNDADSDSSSPFEGPFMCTPQSFPPTPASRAHVLKRGSRFADDVVFLARDQLRVHDGLESSNERTREMAQALTQGKRLAVFDADDASAGIDLSCGQHGKLISYFYCCERAKIGGRLVMIPVVVILNQLMMLLPFFLL